MVQVYRSAIIQAPIAKVWPHLRDFAGIHKLAAAIAERTDIESDGPADQIGSVRAIHTKDGGVIRERLVGLSDQDHSQTYIILDSPLGVSDYVATIHALPVTDGDTTFVEWSASFNCAPGREGELQKVVGDGVFAGALSHLKTLV